MGPTVSRLGEDKPTNLVRIGWGNTGEGVVIVIVGDEWRGKDENEEAQHERSSK
jgi:hypothetical protein